MARKYAALNGERIYFLLFPYRMTWRGHDEDMTRIHNVKLSWNATWLCEERRWRKNTILSPFENETFFPFRKNTIPEASDRRFQQWEKLIPRVSENWRERAPISHAHCRPLADRNGERQPHQRHLGMLTHFARYSKRELRRRTKKIELHVQQIQHEDSRWNLQERWQPLSHGKNSQKSQKIKS